MSYSINKDVIKESKVSNTEEIFGDDDTLTYIDKMYEEVRYKALKEKLLDNIKVDIKTYITELEINKKLSRNDSTILPETHDQKWYDVRIKSLETELARKNDIICMSKFFHNINLQDASCKDQLPQHFRYSDKSLVVLEDIISSCNNKGKTSTKKNDNTANLVMESNIKKLENRLIDVRKKWKNAIVKIIL